MVRLRVRSMGALWFAIFQQQIEALQTETISLFDYEW